MVALLHGRWLPVFVVNQVIRTPRLAEWPHLIETLQVKRSITMNPPPLSQISMDTSALDAASLRLVTRAVEAQAKQARSEASRALLRRIGRLICHSMSISTNPR